MCPLCVRTCAPGWPKSCGHSPHTIAVRQSTGRLAARAGRVECLAGMRLFARSLAAQQVLLQAWVRCLFVSSGGRGTMVRPLQEHEARLGQVDGGVQGPCTSFRRGAGRVVTGAGPKGDTGRNALIPPCVSRATIARAPFRQTPCFLTLGWEHSARSILSQALRRLLESRSLVPKLCIAKGMCGSCCCCCCCSCDCIGARFLGRDVAIAPRFPLPPAPTHVYIRGRSREAGSRSANARTCEQDAPLASPPLGIARLRGAQERRDRRCGLHSRGQVSLR